MKHKICEIACIMFGTVIAFTGCGSGSGTAEVTDTIEIHSDTLADGNKPEKEKTETVSNKIESPIKPATTADINTSDNDNNDNTDNTETDLTSAENTQKITDETETVFDTGNIIYSETGIGNLTEKDLPKTLVSDDGFYNPDMKGIYLAGSDNNTGVYIYILQNYDNGGTEVSGVLLNANGNYAYYSNWEYTQDLHRLGIKISSFDFNSDGTDETIIAMTSDDGENLYIVNGSDLSCSRFSAQSCRDLLTALVGDDYTYDEEKSEVTLTALNGDSVTYSMPEGSKSIDTSFDTFSYVLDGQKIAVYADINEAQGGTRIGGIYVELDYDGNVFNASHNSFRFCA